MGAGRVQPEDDAQISGPDRNDEIAFLGQQEQRLLDIADELDSAGLGAAAQAVLRAAAKLAELKLRTLEHR